MVRPDRSAEIFGCDSRSGGKTVAKESLLVLTLARGMVFQANMVNGWDSASSREGGDSHRSG
jgi:hypothetical protein